MSSFRYGGTGNVLEEPAQQAATQFSAPSSGDQFRALVESKAPSVAGEAIGNGVVSAFSPSVLPSAGAGITSMGTAGNVYSEGLRTAGLPVVDNLATTAGTSAGAPQAANSFSFAGAAGLAAIGYVGGEINSHLYNDSKNANIGAQVGTAAGAAIGSILPGIGTLIGGAIGNIFGGAVGSLFGGTKRSYLWIEQGSDGGDNAEGNWNSEQWDKTVETDLGSIYIEGKRSGNDAVNPIAEMFEQVDAYVAGLLTPEQLEAAKGYIANNPIERSSGRWKGNSLAQGLTEEAMNRRYTAAMMSVDDELAGIFNRQFTPETMGPMFESLISINNDFKASSRLFTESGVDTGNAAIDHVGQMMGLTRPEGEQEQSDYENQVLQTFMKDKAYKQMKDETRQTFLSGQDQMQREVDAGTRRGMPTRPDGSRGLLERGVA